MFHLNYLKKWVAFRPVKATLETAKLVFFSGDTFEEQKIFSLDKAVEILEQEEFDNTRPTVIYFHGYIESLKSESVQVITKSYLKRGDHNVIILDWAELAEGNYIFEVISNSSKLGNHLAAVLLDLINNGLDANKIHLVGHSLGAHIAGLIGRKIHEKSNKIFKIKRISALDPAFAPFYPSFPIFYKQLNKNDADFVDVIHTDAWLYGAPIATGTVDFWPNKGKSLQIGCPKRNYKLLTEIDLCSHQRSWRVWSESVENKDQLSFPAVRCKSWKDFREGKFDREKDLAYMGIDCPMTATGNYFLQTNGETPYSRGLAGIEFEAPKKEEKNDKKADKTADKNKKSDHIEVVTSS